MELQNEAKGVKAVQQNGRKCFRQVNPLDTEKIKVNDWIYTGDLGKIDAEGYLFITGRKKNVIISPSGLNISLKYL